MSAANEVSALTTTSEPPGSGPVGAGASGTPRSPPSSTGPEERSTTRSACGSRVRVRRRIPRPCRPLPWTVRTSQDGLLERKVRGTRRASHPGPRSDRASGIGAPLAAVVDGNPHGCCAAAGRPATGGRPGDGVGMPPRNAPVQDRDVELFAAMTGDLNAVHVDTKRAATQHVRVGMSSRAASPAGLPDAFLVAHDLPRSRRCSRSPAGPPNAWVAFFLVSTSHILLRNPIAVAVGADRRPLRGSTDGPGRSPSTTPRARSAPRGKE